MLLRCLPSAADAAFDALLPPVDSGLLSVAVSATGVVAPRATGLGLIQGKGWPLARKC